MSASSAGTDILPSASLPSSSTRIHNENAASAETEDDNETFRETISTENENLIESVCIESTYNVTNEEEEFENEINWVTEHDDDDNGSQMEPEVESEKAALKRRCRHHFTVLHGIFTTEGTTLRGQLKLLKFMKDIPEEVRAKLPVDGRTLRPPPIQFKRRMMPPGEFTYFGIANMLNYAGDVLFDLKSNEIQLACNMDGLPLTKTPSGKKFWPILGSIGDYPVFVIAAYEGHCQPVCSNDYIRDFVSEVKQLTVGGCNVNGRTYKFRLFCLICDSPATCFIIGCKQHGGYFACRRCKERGKEVQIVGLNAKGKPKTAIRYPNVDEAPRLHEEFVHYAQVNPDIHERPAVPGNIADSQKMKTIDICEKPVVYDSEIQGFRLYTEDEYGEIRPINDDDDHPAEENDGDDQFMDYDCSNLIDVGATIDHDDERVPSLLRASTSQTRKQATVKRGRGRGSVSKRGRKVSGGVPRKYQHHLHPTILTEIPGFDITKQVVLDVMHLVFSGIVKTMLEKWTGGSLSDRSRFKLSDDSLKIISARLARAKEFYPDEFQRDPDTLDHLASWKATQFRSFLLYIGVVVLLGVVSDDQLRHFHLLVVSMRLMCRKLPCNSDGVRTRIVKEIARTSRSLLQEFLKFGNEIYTENFSIYNVHHVVHIPDDYERFEVPLDFLSSFRYENTNGNVKRLIIGHCKPLTQLENKLSSLIHTKMYARQEKNRVINSVEEYYEIPQLCSRISDEDNYTEEEEMGEEEHSLFSDDKRFSGFREIRFRNFKLHTDKERLSCFHEWTNQRRLCTLAENCTRSGKR